MARLDLIAQIDAEIAQLEAEIAQLQHAKTSLGGVASAAPAPPPVKSGRGRPKGSKNSAKKAVEPKTAAKRILSPEGRRAISDAMKRRWEERRAAVEQ